MKLGGRKEGISRRERFNQRNQVSDNVKVNKNDQEDSFFVKYPTMRHLLKSNNSDQNKLDFERISGFGTRSFLSLFVYFLLLLFTILLISLRIDMEKAFNNK